MRTRAARQHSIQAKRRVDALDSVENRATQVLFKHLLPLLNESPADLLHNQQACGILLIMNSHCSHYETKEECGETCVVWFMVMATEPIGGFRQRFGSSFSKEEAERMAKELNKTFGPGANARVEEALYNRPRWERRFPRLPWPL